MSYYIYCIKNRKSDKIPDFFPDLLWVGPVRFCVQKGLISVVQYIWPHSRLIRHHPVSAQANQCTSFASGLRPHPWRGGNTNGGRRECGGGSEEPGSVCRRGTYAHSLRAGILQNPKFWNACNSFLFIWCNVLVVLECHRSCCWSQWRFCCNMLQASCEIKTEKLKNWRKIDSSFLCRLQRLILFYVYFEMGIN